MNSLLQHFPGYHLILFACWVAYAVLHSGLATPAFKALVQRLMGRRYRYYRLLYSIFAAVSLTLILVFQFTTTSPLLYQTPLWLWVIGSLIAAFGLTGMALCTRKYFMNLSGVDVFLKREKEPVLEVGGLHRFVRHPLYSSTLTFCWAMFALFPYVDNLIACVVITLYTILGIGLEEKKLVEEFGDQYRTYLSNTPMLIPNIRKLSEL